MRTSGPGNGIAGEDVSSPWCRRDVVINVVAGRFSQDTVAEPMTGRRVAATGAFGQAATPVAHCRPGLWSLRMGRCEPEQPVVIMVTDPMVVDADLAASSIRCPSCSSGRLRPWGYARCRVVRGLRGTRWTVRPRRGRCPVCAATQVLLPAELVPRHADTVQVVVSGLLAAQSGAGHRRIAADLGVPADTVRTWLRRVTARAGWLYREAVRWAHDLDPLLPAIQPTGSVLGDALSAIGHAVMAVRLRLGSTATAWQLIGRITGGRLLTPSWPSSG